MRLAPLPAIEVMNGRLLRAMPSLAANLQCNSGIKFEGKKSTL